jgi:DNA polymerase
MGVVFSSREKAENDVTDVTDVTGIGTFQQVAGHLGGDVGGSDVTAAVTFISPTSPRNPLNVTDVTAYAAGSHLKSLNTGDVGDVGDVVSGFFRQPKINISYLDIETHSLSNLALMGTGAYVEHPSTQVLVVAYALDDQPVRTWQPGQPAPNDLLQALAGGCRVIAHNFGFDCAVWHHHLVPHGWPAIPLGRWSCTAFRSRLARLPASLEAAAQVLRLPWQKDAPGNRFMRSLTKRNLDTHPLIEAERKRLTAYCVVDVVTLRALDRQLPEIPDEWRELFELDHLMNIRGMPVDLDAVEKLITVRDDEDRRLLTRFRQIGGDGLTSPTQVIVLQKRLRDLGVDLPDLQRETLDSWIAANPDRHDLPAELIRIRREFAHAADAKLDRMIAVGRETGRIRDSFVLHGAHTGRWAGRGVQLQNLPRNTLADTETVLEALCSRADRLIAGQDVAGCSLPVSIKEAIAASLRGLFRAPEGWLFVAADLSQIEARVLCWVAGQDDVLDEYRRGEDVYTKTAERLGSADRGLGKLLVLSAGYGASGRVMYERAPGFGVTLTVEEAYDLTDRWRAINGLIVGFWHELFRTLCLCVELPADQPPIAFNRFWIWRTPETLFVQLPSGRCLKYHQPELTMSERGSLVLKVLLPKGKKLIPVSLWHGAATENVVSAIATDLLMHAMLQLHREGIFLVASIHDEIIALAPVEDAEAIRARMIEVLQTPPEWADDLPLAADAFVNTRFLKPSTSAHAPLAPSAAHRWMACPGSVMAERLAPPSPVSSFAEEGTEAHRIFAECLLNSVPVASLTHDPTVIDPLRHALFLAADVIAGRGFLVEQRLEPVPGMPKVWGTADVIIFDQHERVAAIIDLKFGAGIAVEANAIQLQIYSLLAAQQYGASPDGITAYIIQPRREHVRGPLRSHHLTTNDLGRLVGQLNVAVQATEAPDAPRIPGSWCRFCAAAASCPEYRSQSSARSRPHDSPWLPAGEPA